MADTDIYDKYVDIFNQKRHFRKLEGSDVISADSYVSCADNIRVYIKIKNGMIEDASFDKVSCFVGVVVSEMLVNDMIGKPLSYLSSIDIQYVNKLMGVDVTQNFQMKGCAELPISAFKEIAKKVKK
jgi:NifU-like protein involved in Fe-S cluster formation